MKDGEPWTEIDIPEDGWTDEDTHISQDNATREFGVKLISAFRDVVQG
eukprot:COSAG01_NODE_63107_length_281_cov_0.857143_1_plen_47_part_01